MFLRKISLLKKVAVKPVITHKPVVKPVKCVNQEQFKKLAEKKIEKYEALADRFQERADAIRDKYQDRADAVRDHYKAKADKLLCRGGRLNQKLANKFLALGERKALKLEKLGECKAKFNENLAKKYQWKADCLKKKIHQEDLNDDDVDDDDDDDDNDDDDNDNGGDGDGDTELPDGAAEVKFALSVKGFSPAGTEPGLTNAFITVEVPDDGEPFTLEDAEEAMLDQLATLFGQIDPDGQQGLELDQINLVSVFDADGELLAQFEVVDGEFVKIADPSELLGALDDENAVPADTEDQDDEELAGA